MKPLNRKLFYWLAGCIVFLAVINVFWNLYRSDVEDFDASRYGVSAWEMVKSGDFIRNTWMGHTDLSNLKPLLGFWIIALSFKLLGPTILAAKLPSALFTLLTVLLLLFIVRQWYGNRVALLSTFFFATSYLFLFNHGGRSANLDAGLTFLAVLFVSLVSRMKMRPVWFILAGFVVTLAFLMKSFHALELLILWGAYLGLTKKYRVVQPSLWVWFVAAMLLPVMGWGLVRYQTDGSAFLSNMLYQGFLSRATVTIEGHREWLGYYLEYLFTGLMPWTGWALLFLLLFFQPLWRAIRLERFRLVPITLLVLCWVVVPLTAFSLSPTRCYWYIFPLFPAACVLMARFLEWGWEKITEQNGSFLKIRAVVLSIFLLVVVGAEGRILWKAEQSVITDPFYVLILNLDTTKTVRDITFLEDPTPSAVFYAEVIKGLRVHQVQGAAQKVLAERHFTGFLVVQKGKDLYIASASVKKVGESAKYIVFLHENSTINVASAPHVGRL